MLKDLWNGGHWARDRTPPLGYKTCSGLQVVRWLGIKLNMRLFCTGYIISSQQTDVVFYNLSSLLQSISYYGTWIKCFCLVSFVQTYYLVGDVTNNNKKLLYLLARIQNSVFVYTQTRPLGGNHCLLLRVGNVKLAPSFHISLLWVERRTGSEKDDAVRSAFSFDL